MKYVVDMDSGAMRYIPNFIKMGSGFQKLRGGERELQTRRWQSIS
jgi:hypothetical protein